MCWEIDNFVIKSDTFRRFFICKNILKKLSCYHDNYFRYFMFGKYNRFVSKARVSACMYFLVWRMKFWFLVRRWMILIISTNLRIYTIFHPYTTFVQSLPIHFWQKNIIRPKEVGAVLLTIGHALLYLLNVNLRDGDFTVTQIVSRLLTLPYCLPSAYLIICGDIYPNPGRTSTNTSVNGNSSRSSNCVSRERQPEDKQSKLFCMHMNARSLKKTSTHKGTYLFLT
jgi:hypothetical protein